MSANHPQKNISYTALGLAVGLIFGGLVGLLIDNLVIFAGGGMLLGLAIGAALDHRST
jgi:hypothetical protein